MEKRKYPRLDASGMDISISDKLGFNTGTIKDISRFGLCLTDLPRKLQPENNCVTAIVIAGGKRYKLRLSPQWEKNEGLTIATGTAIDGVPREWAGLIFRLEQQYRNDCSELPSASPRKRVEGNKTLRRGIIVKKSTGCAN